MITTNADTSADAPSMGCLPPGRDAGWLDAGPMPGLDDEEGERVSASLPPVIDAHVHLFPDGVFEAIWRWFDAHGWPIRYKLHTPAVIAHMLSRGVERIVALHYAHKPGMARALNAYMAGVAAAEPRVLGLATVLPGEPGARAILEDAFASGLRGVKLHCHVQCFAADAPALHEVYEACVAADLPLVMHAGREPVSSAYKCNPHEICGADRVERVLRDHPRLRLSVPHLGADELDAYERLLERFDNLWLDTTMVVGGYFPGVHPERLLHARPERIMYGTDFPNIPYAWDREIRALERLVKPGDLPAVLGETARAFFRA